VKLAYPLITVGFKAREPIVRYHPASAPQWLVAGDVVIGDIWINPEEKQIFWWDGEKFKELTCPSTSKVHASAK